MKNEQPRASMHTNEAVQLQVDLWDRCTGREEGKRDGRVSNSPLKYFVVDV